tara:strand:+ start:2252 stop:2362 length:111 start_codon:yes stop_codon:yes gene_type:complete
MYNKPFIIAEAAQGYAPIIRSKPSLEMSTPPSFYSA